MQITASKAPPLHSRFILAIHFDIKMSCKGLDYTLNMTSFTIDFELQMSIFTRLFWSKKSRPPHPAERFAIPCHRCRYLSPGQKGYFYMRIRANSANKQQCSHGLPLVLGPSQSSAGKSGTPLSPRPLTNRIGLISHINITCLTKIDFFGQKCLFLLRGVRSSTRHL